MHQKTNSPLGVGERLYNRNFNPFFCAFDSPVRTATLTAKWQGNPHQVPISPLGGPELKKMTKTNAGNVSILDWPKKPSGFRDQTNQASAMPAATSVLIFTATPSAPGRRGALDRLVEKKLMESHRAFAESRNHGLRSPI